MRRCVMLRRASWRSVRRTEDPITFVLICLTALCKNALMGNRCLVYRVWAQNFPQLSSVIFIYVSW